MTKEQREEEEKKKTGEEEMETDKTRVRIFALSILYLHNRITVLIL